MDQVKLVVPRPVLSDVVHFEYAVRRDPSDGRRIEVDPMDSN
jgi:hypothetical protein